MVEQDSAGNKDRCVTGTIFNYTEQLQLGVHDMNAETKYDLGHRLLDVMSMRNKI